MSKPALDLEYIVLIRQIQHQYKIDSYTDKQLLAMIKGLKKVENEIVGQFEKMTSFSRTRAVAQLEEIGKITAVVKQSYTGVISTYAGKLSALSAEAHSKILSFDGAAGKVKEVFLSPTQMTSYWQTTPVGGKLLQDWVNRVFDSNLKDKIQQEVFSGKLRGESYRHLANRLQEGFGMTKTQVETLVKTYAQSASIDAMNRVYAENTDIVKKLRWTSALSNTTCLVCSALDGRTYGQGKTPPCPVHPRCRCTLVPETLSYEDLGLKPVAAKKIERAYSIREAKPIGFGGRKILDAGTWKGNMESFIKTQPEGIQIQIMGPTRYRLFKAGKLTLAQMVDMKQYRIKTLAEIDTSMAKGTAISEGLAMKKLADKMATTAEDRKAFFTALGEEEAKIAAAKAEAEALAKKLAEEEAAKKAKLAASIKDMKAEMAGFYEKRHTSALDTWGKMIRKAEMELGIRPTPLDELKEQAKKLAKVKVDIETKVEIYAASKSKLNKKLILSTINDIEKQHGLPLTSLDELEAKALKVAEEKAAKKAADEAVKKATLEKELIAVKNELAKMTKNHTEAEVKTLVKKARLLERQIGMEMTPRDDLAAKWIIAKDAQAEAKAAAKKLAQEKAKEAAKKAKLVKELGDYKAKLHTADKYTSAAKIEEWLLKTLEAEKSLGVGPTPANVLKAPWKAAKEAQKTEKLAALKLKVKKQELETHKDFLAKATKDTPKAKITEIVGKVHGMEEELGMALTDKTKLIEPYLKAKTMQLLEKESFLKELKAKAEKKLAGVLDGDDFVQYGGQAGSNKGGFYHLKSDPSQKFYFKFPNDIDRANNEMLAAGLYEKAGIKVARLQAVEMNGQRGIASRIIDGLERNPTALLSKELAADVKENFVVDCWLGNWDVVGASYDNLLVKGAEAWRIDVGGSLRYRAQGALKPSSSWNGNVGELETMLKPSNPTASKVFKGVTKSQLIEGAKKVLAISDDEIKAIVDKFGPTDHFAKKELYETLVKRKAFIAEKFPEAVPGYKKPAITKTTALKDLNYEPIVTTELNKEAHAFMDQTGQRYMRHFKMNADNGTTGYKTIDEFSQQVMAEASIGIRAPLGRGYDPIFKSLKKEGKLLNQFQLGKGATSEGALCPYKGGNRDRWEKNITDGIYQKNKTYQSKADMEYFDGTDAADERPQYGFLFRSGKKTRNANQYGNVVFEFGEDYKQHSTMTYHNSSMVRPEDMHRSTGVAGSFNNPAPVYRNMMEYSHGGGVKDIDSAWACLTKYSGNYIECQVHTFGGVEIGRAKAFWIDAENIRSSTERALVEKRVKELSKVYQKPWGYLGEELNQPEEPTTRAKRGTPKEKPTFSAVGLGTKARGAFKRWTGSAYMDIRKEFIEGRVTKGSYADTIRSTFEKFDGDGPMDGEVTRGIRFDRTISNSRFLKAREFFAGLKPGTVIRDKAPASWTLETSKSGSFSGGGSSAYVLHLEGIGKDGYLIEEISHYRSEAEVLMKPQVKLRVKKIETTGGTIHIYVEKVED